MGGWGTKIVSHLSIVTVYCVTVTVYIFVLLCCFGVLNDI